MSSRSAGGTRDTDKSFNLGLFSLSSMLANDVNDFDGITGENGEDTPGADLADVLLSLWERSESSSLSRGCVSFSRSTP